MNVFKRKTTAQVIFTVLLQKQNYELGEQISGNILFRKDQPLSYKLIKARFIGYETYQLDGKEKTKALTEKNDFVVVAEKGKLPEGDSLFPISFTIPNSLPPSFKCSDVSIKYEIQAEVLFKGSSILTEAEVWILKPIPSEIPPTFTQKKDWGLLHKESIQLRCIPNKICYEPMDKAELEVNIKNASKKDITRMIVNLTSILKYGKKVEKKTVYEQEVPRNLLPIDSNSK